MSGAPPPPPDDGNAAPPPPPPPGGSGGGFSSGGGSATGGTGSLDLGRAFTFAWEAFKANAGVIIAVVLGLLIVTFVLNFAWQAVVSGLVDSGSGAGLFSVLFLSFLGNAVAFVLQVFLQAIIIRAGLDLVDGRGLDFSRLTRTDGLGPLLVASVIIALASIVGFVLCIIPGFIVIFFTWFTLNFIVDDDMSATDGIRASVELVRDNMGSALLLAVVTWVVAFAGILLCGVGYLVSAPVAFIAQVHGYRQLRGGHAPAPG